MLNDEKKFFDEKLNSKKVSNALNILSEIILAVENYMFENGLKQLTPLILAGENDPLNHGVFETKINYYGRTFGLMKSMIIHKQIVMNNDNIEGIYIWSPNIRLEKKENSIQGRHLIEFTQVDFEFKNKRKEEVKSFIEKLIIYVFEQVSKNCKKELEFFNRKLTIPSEGFKTYDEEEMIKKYGDDYELILSEKSDSLFWVENMSRWFYDKYDFSEKKYLNFDIIYNEGFGEGSSGSVRESNYDNIIKRMKETNCNPNDYKNYLELVKNGDIIETCGAGIGIERLLRYICGDKNVASLILFSRDAGKEVII